ncbi:MAG: protein translocase subunit SecD [Pseudomonadota bacterium]
MPKGLRWKFILLALLIILASVLVLPSFNKNMPEWWKKYMGAEGFRLGLDLQGGMHLVLDVDVEQAIRNGLVFSARDLKDALQKKGVTAVQVGNPSLRQMTFSLPNKDAETQARKLISEDFSDLKVVSSRMQGSFPQIVIGLKDSFEDHVRENAVDHSLEIIRNRIDQFGVAEPVIVRQGENEIVVQLPGVKDPKRATALIGQTALLEFKLVDDTTRLNLGALIDDAVRSGRLKPVYSPEDLNRALRPLLPPDTEIFMEKRENKETRVSEKIPVLVRDTVMMTGDAVKNAEVKIGGDYNEPYVALELNDRGTRIFEQITGAHVNQRLAIILDGVVRSAPVIKERIGGGHAQITGRFSMEEANDLSIVLRAGALPAPVNIIQNITVGPSLGLDSINKGFLSGIVGTLLVVVFMVFYYRFSGLLANFALVLNILFLFAALSVFGATLTLPGIAGIILSIGMAVDSNILIFERMREEFALGKPLKAGVDGGYDKALWTIIDSHVTTLITAFALFLFGTGPIKGFAVTLSIGVIFNLFTALFGTKVVYDYAIAKRILNKLNFVTFLHKPNIDFISLRKYAFMFSGVLVLVGLIAFVQLYRGKANLGVDFSGGTMMQFKAKESFDVNAVRQVLVRSNLADLELQEVTNENVLLVRAKKSEKYVGSLTDSIAGALSRELPSKGFTLEGRTEIGSSVSKALREKALIAIGLSLAGIIAYLAFRFDIKFGVAAAVATFHDVLAVLGAFYIMDKEITLLIVTALLTLAGYSLTDTVVVFDRIRETLGTKPKLSLGEIINVSINEVLSRTIITTLTVFLVVMALLLFGGIVIRDFALALLIGVVVGTYSSIFVASPIVYVWRGGSKLAKARK